MRTLLDTNVLVAVVSPDHTFHGPATEALLGLGWSPGTLLVSETVLREWYVVMTRPAPPAANGLGFSPRAATEQIRRALSGGLEFVREGERVFTQWLDLVERYEISGKSAHDARIAAVAIASGIPRVLTFNPGDFSRYAEIATLDPRDG